MIKAEKTSLTCQQTTRIDYAASDFLMNPDRSSDKSKDVSRASSGLSTSVGSIIEHCNRLYTDLDCQPMNPPLKKQPVKPSTSDRFMDHISGENLLINPERAQQLLENREAEIFKDCKDFHDKFITKYHELQQERGLAAKALILACSSCTKLDYLPAKCRSKTKHTCAREVINFFHDFKTHLERRQAERHNLEG